MTYQVELVWNREFDFVPHGKPFIALVDAIKYAKEMEESGDGARVKKTRIVDRTGRVIWQYGRRVRTCKQQP